ncbi:MJ0042 family finger-like domain-containing protein [Malonomonas rubra DSM 5091]|uniref:MJ0042 family finger-like domain-containing protein n=1 Tax=Malonomonas rubra DSM 5091 TaxID=1122189 RepID=A0A1M6LZF9_MALRU|nr:DUF3426 domain-containing protein [Malonomonas rubra]SHJ76568.1 MJ0042 family finger-like domain-containing protein [Malonomonas rubra DSM 5091]
MVIVCPECSTKFRVNSERIPDGGAKVRCARCKHVFLAQKPVEEEIPAPVIESPAVEEPTVAEPPVPEAFSVQHEAPEVDSTSESDFDFGADAEEEQDFQPEPAPLVEEPETATDSTSESDEEPFSGDFSGEKEEPESSFSYDQFRELDPATAEEEDDFSFDSEPETAEELMETSANAEEDFTFSGPADEQIEKPVEPIEAVAEEEEEPAKKKKKYSDEELTALFADEQEQEPVAQEPAVPAPTVKKSSPLGSLIRILLLLILGLAIIGGALYFLNGPEQIEQAIQQLLGQQVQTLEQGRISLSELEGKFINNQEAGELFVIRGAATNNYREPRSSIQVKGIIFDQNGKQLLQKTIFCGNPISDQELQTLPFSKLEEMMRNQFGKAMSNVKVNNKETIPFVIAFRDLPQNLSEFSVDIASSEPAAQ